MHNPGASRRGNAESCPNPCQGQAQHIISPEHFEFTFYLFSSALHNILHAKLPLPHTRSEWEASAVVFGNVHGWQWWLARRQIPPKFECISSAYAT
jgi:hypothetical protein